MKNTPLILVCLALICSTVLVALDKLSPEVFGGLVTTSLAYLAPSPIKQLPVKATAAGLLLLMASLFVGPLGCANTAREACYAESRARFGLDQEECPDEACIDALLARRKAEQEACP